MATTAGASAGCFFIGERQKQLEAGVHGFASFAGLLSEFSDFIVTSVGSLLKTKPVGTFAEKSR